MERRGLSPELAARGGGAKPSDRCDNPTSTGDTSDGPPSHRLGAQSKQDWVECVPNFSEGRNPKTLDAIETAIRGAGVLLLDRPSDADHNRSVFTFVGPPAAVGEAVVAAAAVAVERIDLRMHSGVHPRLGALDVAPLIPLGDGRWEPCLTLAKKVGASLWNQLSLPVYFYGRAAASPHRERLESVRRGGFENAEMAPDLGGPKLHPSAGAVAVGVRQFLIAYNVNLKTSDLSIAKRIARSVRESSGGLPAVKALGLALETKGVTQISMNLADFERTPIHVAFERVRREAGSLGVEVAGAEMIGLAPRRAWELSRGRDVGLSGRESFILEDRIAARCES